jgi:GMP synthase (glutamine-hydrolysing)
MIVHERDCFISRSGLDPNQFESVNLPVSLPTKAQLERADAIMMGGSGDYSVVTKGYDWYEPMLELISKIAVGQTPCFASCFGFQVLVQAMGGDVAKVPASAELGTFEMTLSEQGQSDELFGSLPSTFLAQLGHNDSAIRLGAGLTNLAKSLRCPHQAVRVMGHPVWATQFHPELTDQDNITRYVRYLEAYRDPNMTMEQAKAHAHELHQPSPHSNGLIRRFLEVCFGS